MKQFLIFIAFCFLNFALLGQNLAFKYIEDDEYDKFFKMIEKKELYIDMMISDGENLIGETTPIHFDYIEWAAVKGRNAILQRLVKDSAKFLNFHQSVSRALVLSIPFGQYEILNTLLSSGADINYKSDVFYGQDALHLSLVYKNYNLFFYLLEKTSSVEIRNDYGMSLMHQAAQFGNHKILDTLNKLGLSVNDRDAYMRTPIMYAAWNGNIKNFDYLLDKGVQKRNISSKNENLVTFAAAGGNQKIIDSVLSWGLDVNIKDDLGNTPIHYAVAEDDIETVEKLFQQKADPLITNDNNKSAVDWAIEVSAYDCLLFFVKRMELSKKKYWQPIKEHFSSGFWRKRFKTYLVK